MRVSNHFVSRTLPFVRYARTASVNSEYQEVGLEFRRRPGNDSGRFSRRHFNARFIERLTIALKQVMKPIPNRETASSKALSGPALPAR